MASYQITVLLDYCHIQSHRIPQASRVKRSLNEHSIKSFMDDLSNELMQELYRGTNINEAFKTFSNIFLHCFEKHFPKKRHLTSSNKNKQWVTEELEPSYKIEKSRHFQLIKETKKRFYQCKIVQLDDPVKSAWNTINQLFNKNRTKKELAIVHNRKKVDDTKQIANLFKQYFRSTHIYILKQVNQRATQNNIEIAPPTSSIEDTIFLFPYTPNEL
nr:unnamed protein product [Callosobruchus analis]